MNSSLFIRVNFTAPLTKNLHFSQSILNQQLRRTSRGALPGGYSKEGLKYWASEYWNPLKTQSKRRRSHREHHEIPYYCDLYSHRVSNESINWLEEQSNPSAHLTRAFFGSTHFAPERVLLTLLYKGQSKCNRELDELYFNKEDQYLAWTVQVNAPYELILTYDLGFMRGCTMIAFDPSLRKVYHGNCIDIDADHLSPIWGIAIGLHQWYANFLLKGMVLQLEKAVLKES